jgi:hypothetical protein
MARPWAQPSAANSIHVLGDVHCGTNGITAARQSKVVGDLTGSKLLDLTPFRIQVGDMTQTATTGDDTAARTFAASLPGTWRSVVGNHDIANGSRTGDQAATAYGWNARNFVYDLGFATLIGVSPQLLVGSTTKITLDTVALDYLEAQLAAASNDCIVVAHAPLYNTVTTATEELQYTSTDPEFHLHPSTHDAGPPARTVEGILNASSKAKVFLSGHTHSSLDANSLVKVHSVGSRNVIHINASAVFYVGTANEPVVDPICSLWLTWLSGSVEVRVRNHGAGVWDGIGDAKVTTVTIPA